ncbi:helicase-related protein [Oligoflexaceae bacterium]|nr:helicase-related protein [Oligoflexaceae bacterium]
MPNKPLPIDAHLEQVYQNLSKHDVVLLKAEPGSGKTTRIPPFLRNKFVKKILVLEPRRLAAKLAATWVAKECGEGVGQSIGYRIRFDRCLSAESQVIYITEGLFVRYMQSDPNLSEFDCVIIDEFHERNIHTDLALALVRRIRAKQRPDLKLIIMSATLDTSGLEKFLDSPPVMSIKGRTFPVEIEYQGPSDLRNLSACVYDACKKMAKDKRCEKNILVFLDGIRNINDCSAFLKNKAEFKHWQILPLTAEVPPQKQALIFEPSAQRKIVLSTNVAETSVTIPDVTGVVDSGVAKIAGHATWSGLPTLEVKGISQASAIQRAGRAGRTQAGLVFRLYSEAEYLSRKPFTEPDIRRLEFLPTLMNIHELASHWNEDTSNVCEVVPWFEAPGDKQIESASRTLRLIGALSSDGSLTSLGSTISKYPVHPRLARIIYEGEKQGVKLDALLATCIISEGSIFSGARESLVKDDCDLYVQISVIKSIWKGLELPYEGVESSINHRRLKKIESLFKNLSKSDAKHLPVETSKEGLRKSLLSGYPDRVGKRQIKKLKGKGQKGMSKSLYHFCLGKGGKIAPSSCLKDPPFLIAIDASENLQARLAAEGTLIRIGSGIEKEDLLATGSDLLSKTIDKEIDVKSGRVSWFESKCFGEFEIERTILSEGNDLSEIEIFNFLKANWPHFFKDGDALELYHNKLRLLEGRLERERFPVFEGEMLELLQLEISSAACSLDDLSAQSLTAFISSQLDWNDLELLKKLVPDQIRLENGQMKAIKYAWQAPPKVEGFIQDFYGLKDTPAVLDGSLPLTIQLIGPNKRPIQITADLVNFWKSGYPPLRKEYLRRYPRHHWPEEPQTAPAVLLNRMLK